MTAQTSPTVLFGGVDSLVQDSQDWWYKDQSQLYANWNSMEQDTTMISPNSLDGTVQNGYGAVGYGINDGGNFLP